MKCEDLLRALNEYVDGNVEPGVCDEFKEHLAGCNPCQIVVDNVRQTITLFKAGKPYELPPAFRSRLHGCLRERWAKLFPAPPPAAPPASGRQPQA
jgi:hypothetical protein